MVRFCKPDAFGRHEANAVKFESISCLVYWWDPASRSHQEAMLCMAGYAAGEFKDNTAMGICCSRTITVVPPRATSTVFKLHKDEAAHHDAGGPMEAASSRC